ncbi:hypothetical protein [Brevundimonas nasdae]|uniref:Uncharacterized protein n=1 Tax=Brevundimonas nasdae TaxID=172043 RepID=A0ABX8TF41_9CAUL|nr:hypothetical protein [Brevundimonas nasdae]QYC09806.1 hypothetical protein KWG56_14700 [Brevundimonas nasdae]QYC12595.1 hypothetical protein KWG63_10020 [Brevundimonas nasdae]
MTIYDPPNPSCSIHGKRLQRSACATCNATYMRRYLKVQRRLVPAVALHSRARQRAARRGLPFDLEVRDIIVPTICPALGVPLVIGEMRSPYSPSLDRIRPALGYVRGNTRVISDRANRLKGALDINGLIERAVTAVDQRRADYARLVEYLDRELLLAEVRRKAALAGRAGEEWAKVAKFLEAAFIRADWKR